MTKVTEAPFRFVTETTQIPRQFNNLQRAG